MSSWDQSLSHGYPSSTVPAVVCRQSAQDQTPLYDLLYAHKTAVYQTSLAATVQPANFAADPVAVAARDDQLAFFGLGVNGQIWTSNWTEATGWNNIRSIGELGSDDRLKHRRLKDGQWSDAPGEAGGWEDLAVYGHSAPQAVYVGGPARLMALMVVGRGRQLNLTTVFPLSDDGLWAPRAIWRSAGGNFSMSFMEVGAE
ncbi:hypothetical protein MAPG_00441 [Magnaporthiopsis poae ATCC 64411]|uniref:Uncharacterized protein n=1 Tax=Magnaporthiopsis poae (strain ATCC 64411 / 73-15) TaxID=644358 RepID=A0A0C4DL08_MAGP6|nr:hypothetical protein MAPG_00441 [Magnaporthiopsis poae ATCC 64411]